VAERKYHVGLAQGEVGGYVLVPGDPFGTKLIAEHLEGAEEKAWSREFRTFTGHVGDQLFGFDALAFVEPALTADLLQRAVVDADDRDDRPGLFERPAGLQQL